MPSSSSTSTQFSRLFAPHVILQQDTTRLVINIKSGEGYTLSAGLTLGDVIRYDPTDLAYKKSQADIEENAEVFGVIESGSSSSWEVVVLGSVKYPTTKLNAILDGGAGGKDILFLDESVAGGLTGTINIASGVKIVKPVIQLAPHGIYNGIVVNYIGYKTGNQISGSGQSALVGSIVFGPSGAEAKTYIPLDVDQVLSPTDQPEIYQFFGTTSGPWLEALTITTSSPTLTTGLVSSSAQAYQLKGGAKVNAGIVEDVDLINNIVYVRKQAGVSSMDSTIGNVYINGLAYVFSATTVQDFFVPKVVAPSITQGGEPLVAYLKTTESLSVLIPEGVTLTNLNVTGTSTVAGVNVGTKLAELENKINLLNGRVSAF